ncbi:GAT domain [Sesbania bispinosa]|nr:GAT domain [Sesbania bispinosa]
MATEIESLSLSSLDSMRQVVDLLSDMLQAVNPSDRAAVKDEVIVDLVDRCRTNQKKLMQMLTTTGDEELLGRGLELNDSIQSLLARHDAIASGTPFPIQGASSSTLSTEVHSSVNQTEIKSSSPVESVSTPKASPPVPVYSETRGHQSDEEEEDEFAQLARRHSKTQSVTLKDATAGSSEGSVSMNTSSTTPHVPEPSTSVPSNALALPDHLHQQLIHHQPLAKACIRYLIHPEQKGILMLPKHILEICNTTVMLSLGLNLNLVSAPTSTPSAISATATISESASSIPCKISSPTRAATPDTPTTKTIYLLQIWEGKMTGSGTSSSMSGTMGPGMVGGRYVSSSD